MKTLFRKYKIIGLLCLLLAGATRGYAVPAFQQGGGEKIEAMKIAFITQRLNLSTEEAQKFWPVYNAYRADLKTLRTNFGIERGVKLPAEQQLDYEQKKLDLKKRYKVQFEAAIGIEKTNKLYNLEEEFRQQLRQLQQQRQQRGGR